MRPVSGTAPTAPAVEHLDVGHIGGEAYEIRVRGHRVRVDQPATVGGDDSAPTPTELFVASLAGCVAFYAGRYLRRHGVSPEALTVHADFEMATERPARVAVVRLTVGVPQALPAERYPALAAVAAHCTVHNSLSTPPEVDITLE